MQLLELRGLESPLKGFEYSLNNGKIRMAWSALQPYDLQTDDVLLTIKVKAKSVIQPSDNLFSYGENTELADENANIIRFGSLKINGIQTSPENSGIRVYPNPFRENLEIDYDLNEAGTISISLYNAMGQKMIVLADALKTEGSYKQKINTSDLQSGIYRCEIIIIGKTSKNKEFIRIVKIN